MERRGEQTGTEQRERQRIGKEPGVDVDEGKRQEQRDQAKLGEGREGETVPVIGQEGGRGAQ